MALTYPSPRMARTADLRITVGGHTVGLHSQWLEQCGVIGDVFELMRVGGAGGRPASRGEAVVQAIFDSLGPPEDAMVSWLERNPRQGHEITSLQLGGSLTPRPPLRLPPCRPSSASSTAAPLPKCWAPGAAAAPPASPGRRACSGWQTS